MATATCIKCGGTHFERKDVSLKRFHPKLSFVHCSSCGGVVGVLDPSVAQELSKIRTALEQIASGLF